MSLSCFSSLAFFFNNSSLYFDELGSGFTFPLPLGLVGTTILLKVGELRVRASTGCSPRFRRGINGSSTIKREIIFPMAIFKILVFSFSSDVRVDSKGFSSCDRLWTSCLRHASLWAWYCSLGWVAYPTGVCSSSEFPDYSPFTPLAKRFLGIGRNSSKSNSGSWPLP
ncbi:hypothetical protein SLA2020_047620 [Shorea laevis]